MKIDQIHVYSVPLPVAGGAYRTSSTTVEAPDSTLVEVVTDDGRSGWGETCPLGPVYQPHHALGARAALAELAPGLLGLELASPRAVARRLDELLAGHGYAKAALDTAVLDLLGQRLGVPISTLLGGALVDRVPGYHAIPVASPEQSVDEARAAVERGYPRVQLKVGGRDLARDVETVHRVGEAIGHRARLVVDPNRGMTVAHAVQFDRLCADVPFVLEQPCNTVDEMGQLRGRLQHPVSLDENTEDVDTVLRAICAGTADAFAFKVTRLGGPTKAALARDLCALRSLPHTVDDAWGGDVIAATCLHLAATVDPRLLEGVWIAEDHIAGGAGHYDPDHPVTATDGHVGVPQGPGLGVRPRRELLPAPVAIHQ
ncbi:enolase C-terminal domain-like protein [Actinomycetospora chlora]|uniref:Enolase C-terminal domain-like protein n=1 Tax=Actinomycetospora chlora TaxID=663608 RepID=A0ABP9C9X4_9PSEU